MNTLEITTVEAQIANLAAQGAALADTRRQLADLAAAQRTADEKAKLAEQWAPAMKAIYAALPDWMHPYIEQPAKDFWTWNSNCDHHAQTPVVLSLPDCGPIHIYVDERVNPREVRYAVPEPYTNTYDGEHYVYWHDAGVYGHWDFERLDDSLAIAVYEASKTYEQRIELELGAALRNQEAVTARSAEKLPVPPPEPRPLLAVLERIAQALECISTGSHLP